MKVSILIGSRDRPEMLFRSVASILAQDYSPLELLILDDNSSRHRLDELVRSKFPDDRVHCFRSDSSLGVAGGRNFLMEQASGDIYCFIDDDAYFVGNDCVAKFVNTFRSVPQVGVIAAKIVDHIGQQTGLLVPFTRRQRQREPDLVDTPQLVSYYVGTCHAIDRRVIEQCGAYRHDLMYGEEELDLSYRAVQNGFRLFYLPEVIVHHYPQPSVVAKSGRHGRTELYYHVRNRFFLAYKYLPWRYVPVYLAGWLGQYSLVAARQAVFSQWFWGLVAGIKVIRRVDRSPLGPQAIQYLKAHYGRLWY